MENETTDNQTGVVHVDSTDLLDALNKSLQKSIEYEARLDGAGREDEAYLQDYFQGGLKFAIDLIKEAQSNANTEPRGSKEKR